VLGLDCRPHVDQRLHALAGAGNGNGLWPTEVAKLYDIPLDQLGAGQCLGIIALGGGYLMSDVAAAAAQMGRPVPQVIERSVGLATNQAIVGSPADQEIALDMQIIAGLVPAARIVVYFAGNSIASVADAIHEAVHDSVNRPQVLSICWGTAEKFWHDDIRDTAQAALEDAMQLKVSVTVAAGDFLASGGLSDGDAHVFYPASSPHVLACGGTTVTLENGRIGDEKVWNDSRTGTGGGISDIFQVPDYQSNLALPLSVNDGAKRRGVPDVAAAAAAVPGYNIILDGQQMVKDGTSAVAPLWAALIAMLNAQRGAPIGLINPLLYANTSLFRPITQRDNRVDNRVDNKGYDAGAPWNACTGLRVPKSAEIIAQLSAVPTS
jgi:kumamolisin